MPFYTFSQNNSGGVFDYDLRRGISHFVIIEAEDWSSANDKAEDIGLYWDGCTDGSDCPCCGDRWHPLGCDDEGDKIPRVFGEAVRANGYEYSYAFMKDHEYEVFVHYANKKIKGYS